MSDDAIVLLREDHRELRRALRAFSRTGEVETARRQEMCVRVVQLYASHLEADNDVMYPEVRERVPELVHEVLTAVERNALAERLVNELEHLEPYDEHLAAKMQVLAELTERHVDQDEHDLFPRVRQALGRNDLRSIGCQIRSRREPSESHQEVAAPLSVLVRSIKG